MSQWAYAGCALVLAGVLFVALGLPLIRGRVPRNGFYGYRIPTTMHDDRVWYPVNTIMGIWLVWAGSLATVIGILLLILRNRPDAARMVLGIGVLALFLCLAMGIYRGWRLARAIDAEIHRTDLE
ncbi:hypothetical protein BH09CHL1_BH09CHL1_26580 [soil metagenome]